LCLIAPAAFALQLSGKEVGRLVSRLEAVEARLASHALWSSPALLPGLVALQHKQALAAAARAAKRELKAAQGLVLADELKARSRVLRRLGYLDTGGGGQGNDSRSSGWLLGMRMYACSCGLQLPDCIRS
jgi:ATP-dependent RNA helicase DOB1